MYTKIINKYFISLNKMNVHFEILFKAVLACYFLVDIKIIISTYQ